MEAICVQWTAPLCFASNGPPPISAAGGSAKRRYMILQFLKTIAKADAQLFQRASKEVGTFLIKCSMAYHEKVAMFGDGSLQDDDNTLPAGIRKAIREYACKASWADAYLDLSGKFLFFKEDCVKNNWTPEEQKLQKPLYQRVSRQAFETAFTFFKGNYKLPGVNRYHETPNTQCTAAEFANALRERGCEWCEDQHGFIDGLMFVDEGDVMAMDDGKMAPVERKTNSAAQPGPPRRKQQPIALPPEPISSTYQSYASQHDPVPGSSSSGLFSGLVGQAPTAAG